MALTSNIYPVRRGASRGHAFAAPIAPSETIYEGGLIGVNASNQAQRIQTAGTVGFIGMAQRGGYNPSSSVAGDNVTGQFDTYQLTVPSATPANIGHAVYATDDNTLTLTAPTTGFEGIVGHLVGIDQAGLTWVELSNH